MRRTYSVYPINKISSWNDIFQSSSKNNSISLEKSINKSYLRRKSDYPRSQKIKKLIEEINLSNSNVNPNKPRQSQNEQNIVLNCQKLLIEEKMKTKNYYDNIKLLNKHINELESKISNNYQDNYIKDELIKLRQENKELKLFKEKVFEFSMKYEEINIDIFNCIKSIEKIVHLFNMDNTNKDIEYKNDNLNKISDNFKSILENLSNYISVKQDEYNTLLLEKENEIERLKKDYNNKYSDNNPFGINQNKNFGINNYYEYKKNINKLNGVDELKQSDNFYKIYKTNEYDFGNLSRKTKEFKSSFQNF